MASHASLMYGKATDCHMLLRITGKFKCLVTGLDASLLSFSTSQRCSRNWSPSHLPVLPMYKVLQREEVMQ